MAGKTHRTKVVIEGETKGMGRAKKDAEGLFKAVDTTRVNKGLKEQKKRIDDVTDALKDEAQATAKVRNEKEKLAQAEDKLTRKRDSNGRFMGARKRDSNGRFMGGGGSSGGGGGGGGGRRAPTDADFRRRGAFSQGMAQGLGVGEYMQRGPGMFRQAAGRGVGGMMRGVASTPFNGLGALAFGRVGFRLGNARRQSHGRRKQEAEKKVRRV